MKMTFTAIEARNTVNEYAKIEQERLTKAAENTIEHMIEPAIKEVAKTGRVMVQFHYHETLWEVYSRICLILVENHYEATLGKGNTLKVEW